MNTEQIPDIIQNNLFGLYKTFAVTGHYPQVQHPAYSWIHTDKSVFPGKVFQIDPGMNENALLDLTTAIRNNEAPPFLIFRDDNAPAVFIENLKTQGFRQVMQWPGMAVRLHKNHNRIMDSVDGLTVKKIRKEKDIHDWTGIVELCLFNRERLDRKTLVELARSEKCSLYTGFMDGKAAGTLLSFTQNQIMGLYMIATLPEFRRKGIAWQLTNTAMKDAADKGCTHAVLQSTKQGLSLYHRAGFQEYCNFAIYWLLGKNKHHE
ncbi:MAG: GNAT family N-acetyltransferase [Bacteroidales bacterium]|nr:GNAT family N-acetyltransferase [Bacteroidales bacterium]